jgi:hypothetical protein
MNRNLVHEYQARQAALREAEDHAFLALEAEHASELARIEAKADANTAAIAARFDELTGRIAALEKKLAEVQGA